MFALRSRLGHPIPLGKFALSGAPFGAGYSARVRIGMLAGVHIIEYSSSSPPAAPAVMTFDPETGECVATLSAAAAATLGEGTHHVQLDIVHAVSGVQAADPETMVGRLTLLPEIG